jgi:AraC family transcriptional regulator of adaptative response/methylated-DNA-[protein]-cysteine methyltransferase
MADLRARWPKAEFAERPQITQPLIDQIFPTESPIEKRSLNILVKGTNFQIKVWEALLKIPPGAVCSYTDIARHIGEPKAVRAVGSAVGANAIAYLIPCHRVIRQSGIISDYRWGSTRKKAILAWEAARQNDMMTG